MLNGFKKIVAGSWKLLIWSRDQSFVVSPTFSTKANLSTATFNLTDGNTKSPHWLKVYSFWEFNSKSNDFSLLKICFVFVQYRPFLSWTVRASVSKRVQVRNLWYENEFDLHESELVNGTRFHINGFARLETVKTRFDTEAKMWLRNALFSAPFVSGHEKIA